MSRAGRVAQYPLPGSNLFLAPLSASMALGMTTNGASGNTFLRSVELSLTSVPTPFAFRADRPFLFVIREKFSETILFAGVFVEPPAA
jgi:serine protease inhibitor